MKPIRMCVACRKRFPKEELLRIVNKESTPQIDILQKEQCRGIYLCKNYECIDRAKKIKALNRSLKTEIKEEFYDQIRMRAGDKNES